MNKEIEMISRTTLEKNERGMIVNKERGMTRIKQARILLKKDSEHLEKIKDFGTAREILTMKTRIRIHELTIQMNG